MSAPNQAAQRCSRAGCNKPPASDRKRYCSDECWRAHYADYQADRYVSRADRGPRAKTLSPRAIAGENVLGQLVVITEERPKTRADCERGERPCPWVGCAHHLFLDVNEETGSIKLNFPGRAVEQLKETCSLDVADRGGQTLESVGELLNLTRERMRQIEVRALLKLKLEGLGE